MNGNGASPFWKRSVFGAILWTVGVAGIAYVWRGQIPDEASALEVLGLVLLLFGYQKFRPTAPVAK